MALRFIEGFGGGDDTLGKWDPASSAYSVSTASPRVPGCYYGTGIFSLVKSTTATSIIIAGCGALNGPGQIWTSFYGDGGATLHISVQRNQSTGLIEIRRGSTAGTLLATGTTVIPTSTWFYLESSVTISDTVGEVHVRLNGSPTDEVSFTGDTKNAGTNTTIDKVMFSTNGGSCNFADIYILDTSGTTNNAFLGDVAVRTLSPNGNGTYSQLTNSASTSVSNYSYVNEHGYSGTQYTGSATSGLRDTYNLADLPAGISSVYGVQTTSFMAKSDATLGQAKPTLLTGGTLYYGTTRALSTSYQSYVDVFELNPNTTVSWTVANVNGLEAGMEVV